MLLPEPRRAQSRDSLELLVKMGNGAVARLQTDFGDAEFSIDQKPAGVAYSKLVHKFEEGLLGSFFKITTKGLRCLVK